jgi:hypothetical protein
MGHSFDGTDEQQKCSADAARSFLGGAHMRTSAAVRELVYIALFSALTALHAAAATLPAGFTETAVANGLLNPTAMQFAPDGRLFVAVALG